MAVASRRTSACGAKVAPGPTGERYVATTPRRASCPTTPASSVYPRAFEVPCTTIRAPIRSPWEISQPPARLSRSMSQSGAPSNHGAHAVVCGGAIVRMCLPFGSASFDVSKLISATDSHWAPIGRMLGSGHFAADPCATGGSGSSRHAGPNWRASLRLTAAKRPANWLQAVHRPARSAAAALRRVSGRTRRRTLGTIEMP